MPIADSWIAPDAAVIGKVRLDAGASVWLALCCGVTTN
jgi:carbonic anhydrase/acetyltransferase-like protein (isoleucine patch superfamily)